MDRLTLSCTVGLLHLRAYFNSSYTILPDIYMEEPMAPVDVLVHSASFALASKRFDLNECIYDVEEKDKPH